MKRALAVKCFHLALRLAQFRRGRKALADGLSIHFAGQTEVWAVAEPVPLMTVAVWFPQRPLAARWSRNVNHPTPGAASACWSAAFRGAARDSGKVLFQA